MEDRSERGCPYCAYFTLRPFPPVCPNCHTVLYTELTRLRAELAEARAELARRHAERVAEIDVHTRELAEARTLMARCAEMLEDAMEGDSAPVDAAKMLRAAIDEATKGVG